MENLAKRFCQSKKSVRRVIDESRCERIFRLPLDYVPNPAFQRVPNRAAEQKILGPKPEAARASRSVRVPGGLPPYLASLYRVPLLNAEQERHLFRKLNYLKYKASRLRERLDSRRPRRALMDRIEKLYDAACEVKNEIAQANLRLVVSVVKRHARPTENFFELVSDGNMSLIRAVEKFDYGRGFKFSTYATWAIRKNFARSIPAELRRRERFTTGTDGHVFDSAEDYRTDRHRQESQQEVREAGVEQILGCLEPRERQVIIDHFGLTRRRNPRTLKQIGEELGISKERVRQLEARALDKLRNYAARHRIELPISPN